MDGWMDGMGRRTFEQAGFGDTRDQGRYNKQVLIPRLSWPSGFRERPPAQNTRLPYPSKKHEVEASA